MNQLNTLYSSIGAGRDLHAANIANLPDARARYAELHNAVFSKAGLQKYVVTNLAGDVVERSDDAKSLLTNASGTVRHEDFLIIRDRIVEIRRRKLNGVSDLMDSGLSFSVAISDQLVGFENVNEFEDAEQDMNPNTSKGNDTKFTEEFVPNPITHMGFDVPMRQMNFDYKRSLGLSESVRKVSERVEKTLFNGNAAITVTYAGQAFPIYGYTTHPDRGTGTISDWAAIASIGLIVPELTYQLGLMWSTQGGVDNDSVMVYVSNAIWTMLQNDNKANSDKTVLQRIREIAYVKDVKPAEFLAGTSAVLVEMAPRTVELAVASDIIAVPHIKTNPLAPQTVTTYAAMVHQIKSTQTNQTGIRHLTTA